MPEHSAFDPTLFATVAALAGIWIADVALFFGIPESKYRLRIFIISNVVIWIIINLSIYLSVTPRNSAINAILLTNLIVLVLLIIGSIVYLINFRQIEQLAYLPKPTTPSLSFGLNHIDNVIMPFYLTKTAVTLNDKQDAMSAILRQISLTTVPSTLENLARLGLFEVRPNGKFRILAAHHIDAHRIPHLQRIFKHGANPVGTVGICANDKKTKLVADLTDDSAKQTSGWQETPENNFPGQRVESIICVPVMGNFSDCLAVISVSCSRKNFFTKKHQDDLERYAERVRTLLLALNSRILFDPEVDYGIRAITISGEVGSGKSTLVAELKDILQPAGWRVISVGERFRRFCDENGITVREIGQLPDDIHRQFDEYQRVMLSHEDKVIVEGRLSGYLAKDLPDVLRIFCELPLEERINRVAERATISTEDAKREIISRDQHDLERYKQLYGIQDYRRGGFYVYLQTNRRPSVLVQEILQAMRNKIIASPTA